MYTSERIDDIISKETATELNCSLSLVEMVTRFQFKTANEATHTMTSIELTDLGVFKATKSKLIRKLKTLEKKLNFNKALTEDDSLSERKKITAMRTCNSIVTNIEFLELKKKSYED